MFERSGKWFSLVLRSFPEWQQTGFAGFPPCRIAGRVPHFKQFRGSREILPRRISRSW